MTTPPSSSVPHVPTSPAPPPPAAAPDRAVEAGRGALFIGAAKGVFMLSGFVQQVLLARLVSSAGLGAFGAVNNVVSFVNNTVVQATIQSTSKFTAEDDRNVDAVKRTALKVQAIFGVALTLALFLLAPAIAAFVGAPDYALYYRIGAAIPFLYSLYSVFIGSVNGQRRFRTQAGFDMSFSGIKTVLLLGGAAAAGVAGAFSGFALGAAVILVIAVYVVKLPRPLGGPGLELKRLLPFMMAIVPYNALLNAALLYDQPLLHHFASQNVIPDVGRQIAGYYHALRTLALLPYQALLAVTFVIFPLISRSTFADDREATRAYVRQTLRYALILVAAMGLTLAARPSALLGILYKAEYQAGAKALPILVTGECCLALLAISCSILNAAGRTRAALALMGMTVGVGVAGADLLVPELTRAPEVGELALAAAATATAAGMVLGFLGSVAYLRLAMDSGPPLATVARVLGAGAITVLVGRFLPGGGKVAGLAITALVPIIYFALLIALREFGPQDREKLRKIFRRR